MRSSLTRIERFSAAHRLNSEALTVEENASVYGKCNNFHGHGHNYRLEVTFTGPIDQRTGMIVDLGVVKGLLRECVLDRFDHTHLDLDHFELFEGRPRYNGTTENFLLIIWEQLRERQVEVLPVGVRISKLVLAETEKNVFTLEP